MTARGDIILLNGTSSVGKTTLARAIQAAADEPFFLTGIDHFLGGLPPRCMTDPQWVAQTRADGALTGVQLGHRARSFLTSAYRAIAEIVRGGTSVIVDDVLYDDDVRAGAEAALADFDPLFVGLFAPLHVVEARERERGDRAIGGARSFYALVHQPDDYDLRIDTATCAPREAAADVLAARSAPRTAFRRIANRQTRPADR